MFRPFKRPSSGHSLNKSSIKSKTYGMLAHCVLCLITGHNMPIHNILSTVPQLSISQKALGTLPDDGNVMPKHVGAAIHN
jgi:hypothetical protein